MMGNFSFGDYFKEKAIPWAWEYVTEDLGLDGDRIWITVHTSDDEAEQIWHDVVGVPIERIQRLGDKDNFWQMGDTGPCGPCSELHIDRGPAYGPDGGPLADPAGERFMEFWNLVFMQYDQAPDGTRTPLPRPSIDTGAGLERILTLLQGVDSVWDTDVLRPIIEVASSLTGHAYGRDERTDVSLRILAEHARSGTMLVNDGVFPSNEDRGYVLRRILRRAVRHAFLLGADKLVMPGLVEESIAVMGEAYPDVVKNRDFITGVITREEERFRQTLRTGLTILEDELSSGATVLPGAAAFKLHDTFGFPLEVTTEITAERGVEVDVDGFNVEMAEQRRRAKEARKTGGADDDRVDRYRELVEQFGTTEFFGDSDDEGDVRVLAVVPVASADGADAGTVEIFTDRTPFYAESGGQVGDTGTITTATGRAEVLDTTYALPGLRRHVARIEEGELVAGQEAHAAIDAERRRAIRRNHTGTHILHWALRQVLGNHVKQAGSLVAPDRLRFDFSHYAPVTADEIERIEALANGEVLEQRPRAGLRDDEGRGRGHGRHRLLRRQVRRRRAGARGRPQQPGALRRHACPRARRHRHHQDRQRGLDRLQPPPHRGRDRHGQRRAAPARRAGAGRAGRSAGHDAGRGGRRRAPQAGRDQGRSRTRSARCGRPRRRAGRPSWPPAASAAWSSPASTTSRRATSATSPSRCASSPA